MMNLQEVRYVGINWIKLAYDRDRWRGLVNALPSGSIKSGEFLE
jgi:hypothetical protein